MLDSYYHERYAKDNRRMQKPKTVGRGGFQQAQSFRGAPMIGQSSMKIQRTNGKGGYSQRERDDRAKKLGYSSYDDLADAVVKGDFSYDSKTNVATRKDTGQSYDYDDYSYTPTSNTQKGSSSSSMDKAKSNSSSGTRNQTATSKRETEDKLNKTLSQLGMSRNEYNSYIDDLSTKDTNKYEYFAQPRFSEEQREIALGDAYSPRVQQGDTSKESPYYDNNYNKEQEQAQNRYEQEMNQVNDRYQNSGQNNYQQETNYQNNMTPNQDWMNQFYNQQQSQWQQQQQQYQQQQNMYQNQMAQMQSALQDMQSKYAQMMENMGYYQQLQNYQNMYGMRSQRGQQYSPFM